MKSRLVTLTGLLVLFVAPAFADTISIAFTNQGVSGSLTTGVISSAMDLAFDGTVIEPGPFATLIMDLGSFTGSLKTGGTFTGGTFELVSGSSVLFQTSFSGTWDKIGKGVYDLAGSFSTVFDGVQYTGTSDQTFKVYFDDGRACLRDLSGQTNITANTAVVPEPGTMALLGTGIVSLLGAARRKSRG